MFTVDTTALKENLGTYLGCFQLFFAYFVGVYADLSAQSDTSSALVLSASAQASAYLLASTLIWAAPVLQPARQGAVLQACLAALQRVKAQYRSPFSVGGLQAVFSTFSAVAPEDRYLLAIVLTSIDVLLTTQLHG